MALGLQGGSAGALLWARAVPRGRRHFLCVDCGCSSSCLDLPRQKFGAVGRWVVMAAEPEVVKLRWA